MQSCRFIHVGRRRLGEVLLGAALATCLLSACRGRDETVLIAEPSPLAPMVGAPGVLVPTSGLDAGSTADAAAPPSVAVPGASEDAGTLLPVVDAGEPSADAGVLSPPLGCERLDPDSDSALAGSLLTEAIDVFYNAQQQSCRTAALLAGAPAATVNEWVTYLYLYSYALFACPYPDPPEGGLDVFALANTAVSSVGVPLIRIGADDADALIEQYLDALGTVLVFRAGERELFEAYLQQQAGKVVASEVSGALSTCGAAAP